MQKVSKKVMHFISTALIHMIHGHYLQFFSFLLRDSFGMIYLFIVLNGDGVGGFDVGIYFRRDPCVQVLCVVLRVVVGVAIDVPLGVVSQEEIPKSFYRELTTLQH